MDLNRIVVVGASLAGVRAAETLRSEGYEGSLVIVGEEPHRPYDRPPLSKQFLTGEWDTSRIALPAGAVGAIEAVWELGVAATSLDLDDRRLDLSDGRSLEFDGLVLACGAEPRRLAGTEGMAAVHTLRTLDDARAVAARLAAEPRRVVVVGAGFIGAEVAASARGMGLEVTLVEPLPQPLSRVLGDHVGAVVADLHRDHGVDVRLGVGVQGIAPADEPSRDAGSGSQAVEVGLADGSTIDADLVVVGIGVVPRTGWLEGSGLTLDDGVVCDQTTLAAPGVVAAGDVARWPSRRYEQVLRVEHWDHAVGMGAHAARRLLVDDDQAEAFDPVPYFWSDQYDRKLQLVGRSSPGDEHALVAGSYEDRRFCVLYGRQGRVTAALGMNMPARVMRYSRALTEGLAWDDALADAQT